MERWRWEGDARAQADGRRRAVWEGELEGETDEEAVKAYVLPEEGKLRVFRCRECGVRIAQEADVCRQPSLKRWKLSATFTRTFNLVRAGGSVCCLRCGANLFPFDEKDPALLTLPLYWNDKRLFKKTALRGTVVLDMGSLGGVFSIDRKSKEPRFVSTDHPHQQAFLAKTAALEALLEAHLGGRDIQTTVLIRYGLFPEQRQEGWKEKTQLEHYRKLYRDAGASFHLMPYPETVETLTELPAQDLGVYLLWTKDEGNFIQWTDFNAEWVEPGLVSLWMACGGNMLFGNWFIPNYSSADDQLDAKGMEDLADRFDVRPDRRVETNAQPAFAQLVRDGHYLGYWPSASTSLPNHVCDKIVDAADYRLLYPRWLFLRDFPPSQFDNPKRRQTDNPFALVAKDKVVPRLRNVVVQDDDEQHKCIIL